MKILATLLLLVSFWSAALGQAEDIVSLKNDDYIIFWTCGGMAMRTHYKVFYISNSKFSVDATLTRCYEGKGPFLGLSFKPFNDSVYSKVRDIVREVPIELLGKKPYENCSKPMIDAGCLNILAQINGRSYSFVFYVDISECDSSIRRFVEDIGRATGY